MNGILIGLIAAKYIFLLLAVYSGACIFDLAVTLKPGSNGTFMSKYNIYSLIFRVKSGNSGFSPTAIATTITKAKSAFKVSGIVTLICLVLTFLCLLGQKVYEQYETQLKTAAMAVQILSHGKDDDVAKATMENYSEEEDGIVTLGLEGGNDLQLQGQGTIVEKVAAMIQQSYADAGVPGTHKYGQYYITMTFNGQTFKERPDCTGLFNSIVKCMGYFPPDTKNFNLATCSDWCNSGTYCRESSQILDISGNPSPDWVKIPYTKDAVQPGDFLVRPAGGGHESGHGEIAVGWDGNKLYGFNYGGNTQITKTQNACKDILENGTDPLEACKKAGSTLSPGSNWGGGIGYKYIYRYVGSGSGVISTATGTGTPITGAGWVQGDKLISGAPNSSGANSTSSDKNSGAPIVAAVYAALQFEAAGYLTYDMWHAYSSSYPLTFGDTTIDTRPDCSGYMSTVMWLLGVENAKGIASGAMISLTPKHADGTAATEWQKITVNGNYSMVQPGDILLRSGHTEMFVVDDSGWYGLNYGETIPISKTNKAAHAIQGGAEPAQATKDNNSTVRKDTATYIWRYTGDGKGTRAEQLGYLNGFNFSNNTTNTTSIDVNAFESSSSNWVDRKDMFRHGGATGTVDDYEWVKYASGMASGDTYVVNLTSGNYYWYHQTPVADNCDYCSYWTDMAWGDLSIQNSTGTAARAMTLGTSGDPVYAAAILASNLTNTEATPVEILGKAKVSIAGDKSFADTTSSPYFNDTVLENAEDFFTYIAKCYSLDITDNLAVLDKQEVKDTIDKTLTSNGLVLLKVKAQPSGDSWWPTVSLKNHYCVVYKSDTSGYYLLDQIMTDHSLMTKPIDFEVLYKSIDGIAYGVTNPNPPMIRVKKGSNFGNGNWYNDASGIAKYTSRVDLGNNFYLYNGLPWDANSKTYTVDTDQMLRDLFDYTEKVSNGIKAEKASGPVTADDILNAKDASGTRMFASKNKISDTKVNSLNLTRGYGGTYKTLDGVQCICVGCPPAVLDRYYCVGFGSYNATGAPDGGPVNYWSQKSVAYESGLRYPYDYGKRKMCLILQKYDDNSVWYLPITHFDAKAHTFPGGVCQTGWTLAYTYTKDTHCTLDSSGTPIAFDCRVCASGTDFALHWSGKMSELMTYMNKKEQADNSRLTMWDCVWNVVEPWDVPSVVKSKVINSHEYRVMGYVVYEENPY